MSTQVQRARRMRTVYPRVYGLLSLAEAVSVLATLESRKERKDDWNIRRAIKLAGGFSKLFKKVKT